MEDLKKKNQKSIAQSHEFPHPYTVSPCGTSPRDFLRRRPYFRWVVFHDRITVRDILIFQVILSLRYS